jgi:predicted kinase
MILEPDSQLVENGVYLWTPERRERAIDWMFDAYRVALSMGPMKAVAMVGAPGAGKSTLARKIDRANLIVLDALFIRPADRQRFTQIASTQGAPAHAIWLDTAARVCEHRNRHRSADRRIPREIIEQSLSALLSIPPTTQEGFMTVWRIQSPSDEKRMLSYFESLTDS